MTARHFHDPLIRPRNSAPIQAAIFRPATKTYIGSAKSDAAPDYVQSRLTFFRSVSRRTNAPAQVPTQDSFPRFADRLDLRPPPHSSLIGGPDLSSPLEAGTAHFAAGDELPRRSFQRFNPLESMAVIGMWAFLAVCAAYSMWTFLAPLGRALWRLAR